MSGTASDPVWTRDEPDSPCVRVCVQHPAVGLCLGCFRSAEEVAEWANLSPEERKRIRRELPSRETLVNAAGVRRRRPRRRGQ